MEGVDIWKLDADRLAEFRLAKIGFVFQDFHLFPASDNRGERSHSADPEEERLGRIHSRGDEATWRSSA